MTAPPEPARAEATDWSTAKIGDRVRFRETHHWPGYHNQTVTVASIERGSSVVLRFRPSLSHAVGGRARYDGAMRDDLAHADLLPATLCNATRADYATDPRACTREPGHPGKHSDGTARWGDDPLASARAKFTEGSRWQTHDKLYGAVTVDGIDGEVLVLRCENGGTARFAIVCTSQWTPLPAEPESLVGSRWQLVGTPRVRRVVRDDGGPTIETECEGERHCSNGATPRDYPLGPDFKRLDACPCQPGCIAADCPVHPRPAPNDCRWCEERGEVCVFCRPAESVQTERRPDPPSFSARSTSSPDSSRGQSEHRGTEKDR